MNSFKIVFVAIIAIANISYSQNAKYNDIRKVDFMNFTYPAPVVKDHGWIKEVNVKNGKFEEEKKEGKSYFYFGVNVLYGDINYDKVDEAIIITHYGSAFANWNSTEILVYTLKNKKPFLLANLNQKSIEKDYAEYYKNSFLWPIYDVYLSERGTELLVEINADGNHAQPQYHVFMRYNVDKNRFILNEKPARSGY